MACCVKGGVGTTDHISQAYDWACNNGLIRCSDTYVYDCDGIARGVSDMWGIKYHPDYYTVQGVGHFWLHDGNGNEVFNAAGLGYHGN